MASGFDSRLVAFMAAIRRLESGSFAGNYRAHGRQVKGDYAYGAYQIMTRNWAQWARDAGIPGADMRDPAAQDLVARNQMTAYWNRYHDWALVAVAWFAGGKVADRALKYGIDTVAHYNDANGMSVGDYANQVTSDAARYHRVAGGQEGDFASSRARTVDSSGKSVDTETGQPLSDVLRTYGDPNSDLWDYLNAPPSSEDLGVDEQAMMRNNLVSILDTISNTVAGGSRQPAGATIGDGGT